MRRHTAVLVATSILISAGSVQGQVVLYAHDDVSGASDGSRCDAHTVLQDALAVAEVSGGTITEIRVGQGVYVPNQSSATPGENADRGEAFQLLNGVTLIAACAGWGDPASACGRLRHLSNHRHVVRTSTGADPPGV